MGQANKRGKLEDRIQQALLRPLTKEEQIRRSRQALFSMSQDQLAEAYANTPAQKTITERRKIK